MELIRGRAYSAGYVCGVALNQFNAEDASGVAQNESRSMGFGYELPNTIVIAKNVTQAIRLGGTQSNPIVGIVSTERSASCAADLVTIGDVDIEDVLSIRTGDLIILDAERGFVIHEPDPDTLNAYMDINRLRPSVNVDIGTLSAFRSSDGVRVEVLIDITRATDADSLSHSGADGLVISQTFTEGNKPSKMVRVLDSLISGSGNLQCYLTSGELWDHSVVSGLAASRLLTLVVPIHSIVAELQDSLRTSPSLLQFAHPVPRIRFEAQLPPDYSTPDDIDQGLLGYWLNHFEMEKLTTLTGVFARARAHHLYTTVILPEMEWDCCLYAAMSVGAERVVTTLDSVEAVKCFVRNT